MKNTHNYTPFTASIISRANQEDIPFSARLWENFKIHRIAILEVFRLDKKLINIKM